MGQFDENSYISSGSLGAKIRRYRELRGLTQRQLGLKCGFSPATAEVRIFQYEKNRKLPKESMLKTIALALDLDEYALFDLDLKKRYRMYHVLFEIEDFHGLHPVKTEDGFVLEFGGPTILNRKVEASSYQSFLCAWYEAREKCRVDSDESSEEVVRKISEYTLWRGEYPVNVAEDNAEKMRDAMRESRLRAELDELIAKRSGEAELQRINKAVEKVLPTVKKKYEPIRNETDFTLLLKEAAEKGISISCVEIPIESDPDYRHLLSIKSEDITMNEETLSLYARILWAVESMQDQGTKIVQGIIARNEVLFVTYKF